MSTLGAKIFTQLLANSLFGLRPILDMSTFLADILLDIGLVKHLHGVSEHLGHPSEHRLSSR